MWKKNKKNPDNIAEKKELIPNELHRNFKEPVEIIHFPLNGKLISQILSSAMDHSNTYRFHRPGMRPPMPSVIF
jgi:hypothetical protein